MQMLYDSDHYAVLQFDVTAADEPRAEEPPRGGYEIVDKFARKEIFLAGALAESFRRGVQTLMQGNPTQDDVDEFLAGFSGLAHQPVRLH